MELGRKTYPSQRASVTVTFRSVDVQYFALEARAGRKAATRRGRENIVADGRGW